jgi:hypothetical protein
MDVGGKLIRHGTTATKIPAVIKASSARFLRHLAQNPNTTCSSLARAAANPLPHQDTIPALSAGGSLLSPLREP